MGAIITISGLSLAADGRTLTGTLAGGTAPYAISSVAGLDTFTTGSADFIVPLATPTISGTTITIVLQAAWPTGAVFFGITAANTLTDSAANTGAVSSSTAVTNNATYTGTTTRFTTNPSLFNFNGCIGVITANGSLSETGTGLCASTSTSANVGYSVEYILNVTSGTVDVDIEGFIDNFNTFAYWSIDGGAQQVYHGSALGFEFFRIATGLGVGKHLIRHNATGFFYTRSVRVRTDSGTASLTTVPCPVALFRDNLGTAFTINATSPVARWGTQRNTVSTYNNVDHPGFQFNFKGNFQGADFYTNPGGPGSYDQYAIAVDQGINVPLAAFGPAITNGTQAGFVGSVLPLPICNGLSAGNHQVEVLDLSFPNIWKAIRVWNGSVLASSAAIGATSISVPDITNIAAGDWIAIDSIDLEEAQHVNTITGTGPYTLNLTGVLALNHAAGVSVRNYAPANAPTLVPVTKPTFAGRLVAIGDSITHAAAIDTAGNPIPGYAMYDPRSSWAFMAAKAANWEFNGAATQGWTVANTVGDNFSAADFLKPANVYAILIGTNDFGAAVTSIASYTSSLETLIGQCKTAAPSGCTIYVVKIFSPLNETVNPNGNTKADFNAAQLVAIANQAASGYVIKQVDLTQYLDLVNPPPANGDIPLGGAHLSTVGTTVLGNGGENKVANAFLPYLTGTGLVDQSMLMAMAT